MANSELLSEGPLPEKEKVRMDEKLTEAEIISSEQLVNFSKRIVTEIDKSTEAIQSKSLQFLKQANKNVGLDDSSVEKIKSDKNSEQESADIFFEIAVIKNTAKEKISDVLELIEQKERLKEKQNLESKLNLKEITIFEREEINKRKLELEKNILNCTESFRSVVIYGEESVDGLFGFVLNADIAGDLTLSEDLTLDELPRTRKETGIRYQQLIERSTEAVIESFNKDKVKFAELRVGADRDRDTGIEENIKNNIKKIKSSISGIKKSEKNINKNLAPNEAGMETKIIFGLKKGFSSDQKQFNADLVKGLLQEIEKDPDLSEFMTGFDVAHIEEAMPPKDFKDVFDQIHEYNKKNPENKLGITYHVGESYSNTSIESAIRHVDEIVEYGGNRIGHGLVLGLDFDPMPEGMREESVEERIDQIYYDLKLLEEGIQLSTKKEELEKELGDLKDKQGTEIIQVDYNQSRIQDLKIRQEYVLNRIKQKEVVIEGCPTSNVRIGGLKGYESHPIKKFIETGVDFTINTDDAGIFDVNLSGEVMEISKAFKLENDKIFDVMINSYAHHFGKPLKFGEQIRNNMLEVARKYNINITPELEKKLNILYPQVKIAA